MQTDQDFRIDVSLSKENFIDKTISNAMIGSARKNPEFRRIRKEYGFDSRSGVSFEDKYLTQSELLNNLLEGKAVCAVFNPSKRKKNGGFGSYQKKNWNFCYSQFIGVDVDKTNYKTPEEYIKKLSLKPSFWYTSYSNMIWDEVKQYGGPHLRLIYVFSSYIDSPLYFRYCANSLNDIIKKDIGEKVDECNMRCVQYYNGTNINNKKLHVNYGITNIVYDVEDIGVNLCELYDTNYIEFLCSGCGYKTLTKNKRYEICRELNRVSKKDYHYNHHNKRFEITQQHSTTINEQAEKDRTLEYEFEYEFEYESNESGTYSSSIQTILYDWDRYSTEDFIKCSQWIKALKNTKYVYRMERDWGNKKYQWVNDDYFSLFLYREKQKDKQRRRINLYERMCLRRVLSPEITKDDMVVNTIIDIIRFFDREGNVLDSDFIKRNIDTCFSQTIEDIKIGFKGTIHYLIKNTKPKRGYILKRGVEDNQEMTYEILDDIYISNYNVKDNFRMIHVHTPYNFSLSTLYEYCDNRGIKTDKDKLTDEEVIELIDLSLPSKNKIHQWFKNYGFKVGDKRLRKLILQKEKNEKEIRVVESQTKSTTINVQAEKDRTHIFSSLTGDKKVDLLLKEEGYYLGIDWEDEFNDEYYRQKEIYSTMSGEEVLDDIIAWCTGQQ